jgi:hypothetical protein
LPPQRRDPVFRLCSCSCSCFCRCRCFPLPSQKQTSSRPKAAHFAAAVERSLYFAVALAVVLAVAVVVAVAIAFLCHPKNKRHLDQRRRTLPPQWRDPCISPLHLRLQLQLSLSLPLLPSAIPKTNVISTEGGALGRRAERSLYFAFVVVVTILQNTQPKPIPPNSYQPLSLGSLLRLASKPN